MDVLNIGLFVLGLVVLVVGAEIFVQASTRLARTMGVSPLVIGLTVVAFGTSAPELAVSLTGALAGQPDVSLGNVVGSSIFNVLVVLGLAAVVAPLTVDRRLVRVEVPIMIAVSALVWAFASDGRVSGGEGGLLFAGALGYTLFALWRSRRDTKAAREALEAELPSEDRAWPLWLQLVALAGGLGLLVVGSRWMVEAAVVMAVAFGVSELVISLTIIAAGTSLPEIATSAVAGLRGQGDIAVGNAVGSNLFNLLMVLGLTAVVVPGGVEANPAAVAFDLPVMVAVAVACLPVFIAGQGIARWEGALFLAYYVAYTTYLLLQAAEHDALPRFSQAMLLYVVPLTAVTLVVVLVRDLRGRGRAAAGAAPPPDAPRPPG